MTVFSSLTTSQRRYLLLTVAVVAGLTVLAATVLRPGGPLARDLVWARIQERGVWRVAMDPSFPPFESLDADGSPVGLDVELVNEVARRMGVKAEITAVGFDELVDAVAARRVDAAVSALPEMPWRTREVVFSRSYVDAGLILAAPVASPIASVEDLSGKRVAAEWGSQADAFTRDLASATEMSVEILLQETSDAALKSVLDGQADAAIVDAVTLALFDRQQQLKVVGASLQPDPYVIYMPVNAPRLHDRVNATLDEMERDGSLRAIRERWLGR